ncbi:helix-turn-helix domain-containing protein [Solibaculum mannosilyticum]|uniref:helix-turn-helix domain-containing protein n=1 Tax=Solibaculum mannosilyticum TaxID=2780922 RepID=UPI0007A8468E|nr:helix-turn-helix protein [Eubacteriaceae bacterium CHKCI005]
MDLGDMISKYRKQKGMTINDLAEKSGVPKGTLNKIIAGTTKAPTLETVRLIAYALDLTLNDFDDTSPASMHMSSRDREHIKKYQSLSETGKDNVDKYTDYILSNEAAQQEKSQEAGKKGEKNCEATSPRETEDEADVVRVAVYDADGKIIGYDLVTREIYEKLEELGFTIGQERELRVAQPTDAEVGLSIEGYLKQKDEQ